MEAMYRQDQLDLIIKWWIHVYYYIWQNMYILWSYTSEENEMHQIYRIPFDFIIEYHLEFWV